jgi:hypothetical protein
MTRLESEILNCKNSGYFFQLNELIQTSERLTNLEKDEFNKIWKVAIDFDNWNYSDLMLGCKITHQRLKDSFNLSDECIGLIVNAAAYEWK